MLKKNKKRVPDDYFFGWCKPTDNWLGLEVVQTNEVEVEHIKFEYLLVAVFKISTIKWNCLYPGFLFCSSPLRIVFSWNKIDWFQEIQISGKIYFTECIFPDCFSRILNIPIIPETQKQISTTLLKVKPSTYISLVIFWSLLLNNCFCLSPQKDVRCLAVFWISLYHVYAFLLK